MIQSEYKYGERSTAPASVAKLRYLFFREFFGTFITGKRIRCYSIVGKNSEKSILL